MEVDLLPWNLVEITCIEVKLFSLENSMEISIYFHGRRLKKQILRKTASIMVLDFLCARAHRNYCCVQYPFVGDPCYDRGSARKF